MMDPKIQLIYEGAKNVPQDSTLNHSDESEKFQFLLINGFHQNRKHLLTILSKGTSGQV